MTPKKIEKMKMLRAEGMPIKDVAKRLKCSPWTISYYAGPNKVTKKMTRKKTITPVTDCMPECDTEYPPNQFYNDVVSRCAEILCSKMVK